MAKDWAIDWELLFQNFANFCHLDGENTTCIGLLLGVPGRIHLPLFSTSSDDATRMRLGCGLTSDLDLVGVIRVGGSSMALDQFPVPKKGLEMKVEREQLQNRDKHAIKKANPSLVDAPHGADMPPYVITKANFECTLRVGQERTELTAAYERQLALLDSISFLATTPERLLLSPRSTTKEKSPFMAKHSRTRLRALQSLSPPPSEEESIVPVVRVARGATECIKLSIPMESVAVIVEGESNMDLYQRLVEGVRRRMDATHFELQKAIAKKSSSLSLSSALFMPPGWTRPLCLQCPTKHENEEAAVEWRRSVHRLYNLSPSFPCVRPGQNLLSSTPGLLRDLHKHIKSYKPIGEVEVVKSGYDYYHYMQQNFDDCGWGCAYRSGQTIISWFLINGLTDGAVPTHREIQQCLVDIGDKPAKFVGSKQWIGSTELGFMLETLYNLQYKIMTTNSGVEVAERARELLYHFRRVGTPVMIGGGQYAYTILGVDMDVDSGEVRFLVLDPHYTGRDEVNSALSGGCEWKKANFWKAESFYNLLLPQVSANNV